MGLMCLRGKVRELAPEIYKVTTLCLKIQVRWAGERSKKRVEDRKRKAPREREREREREAVGVESVQWFPSKALMLLLLLQCTGLRFKLSSTMGRGQMNYHKQVSIVRQDLS